MSTNREVKRMLKTISLRKLIELPKLKMKKSERVYDKEWHMYFSCEEERLEFRAAIERAENDPVSYTQEEVDEMLYREYGIEV